MLYQVRISLLAQSTKHTLRVGVGFAKMPRRARGRLRGGSKMGPRLLGQVGRDERTRLSNLPRGHPARRPEAQDDALLPLLPPAMHLRLARHRPTMPICRFVMPSKKRRLLDEGEQLGCQEPVAAPARDADVGTNSSDWFFIFDGSLPHNGMYISD